MKLKARLLILSSAIIVADPGIALAQTAEDFFDPNTMQEIRLFMASRDLRQLRATYRDDTYYAADFQWRDIRVRNAAIRSRGQASRNDMKPALRVDFNRFASRQKFLGLKSVILKNLWQDGSMMHERLAMQLFARLGLPAPRETYCRLYINNEFHGLYAIVESVDDSFLQRTIGEDDGHLFSYQFKGPYWGEFLGDDIALYKSRFEPQNHEREADSVLYGPIRDLFREGEHPVDAVWRERVEQYLDLSQFVTHVAVESYLAEGDGVLGFNGMNNFYLYRMADTNRHRFFPWDKDSSFLSHDHSILYGTEENGIFRKAFAFDDLRDLYFQVLETAARSAVEDNWLDAEIVRSAELVTSTVQEDTRKSFSTEAFFESIEMMRDFARRRSTYVLEQVRLARARR
jgi:spore coat protein CotH